MEDQEVWLSLSALVRWSFFCGLNELPSVTVSILDHNKKKAFILKNVLLNFLEFGPQEGSFSFSLSESIPTPPPMHAETGVSNSMSCAVGMCWHFLDPKNV